MINAQVASIILILIGLYGMITKKRPIKQVLSLNVMMTGLVLFFIAIGFVRGDTIPILPNQNVVDPLPSTLMLTTLVVDVSLTTLALILILKMEEEES